MIYLASLTEETGDKIRGYHMIHTKEELDIIIGNAEQSNKVIIRNDFSEKYFTPSGLISFIENARKINRNVMIELDKISEVLTPDTFTKKISSIRNMEELLILASRYPKEFLESIGNLTREQSVKQEELLSASGTVARLHSIIHSLNEEKENISYALKLEQENKFQHAARLSSLVSRINYQYGVDIDESRLFLIDSNSYDKVIYIKEITRVQYVDSFIYYLKEILKVLYMMPARLVVVESYYANGKVALYPDLKPHYALKERDVLSGDILMLGLQPKIMEDILRNPSNISILIVLDRAGYKAPYLKGDNVEYFFTVSDKSDIPEDIPLSHVISYSEETLYIPFIDNFLEMDMGERISRYSSTTIMKQVIGALERS